MTPLRERSSVRWCRPPAQPRRAGEIYLKWFAAIRRAPARQLRLSVFGHQSIDGGLIISLSGTVPLITGGSRGIGDAAVKLFAQAGADVVFNYNKAKDAAQQVEQEAARHGTRVA